MLNTTPPCLEGMQNKTLQEQSEAIILSGKHLKLYKQEMQLRGPSLGVVNVKGYDGRIQKVYQILQPGLYHGL